VITVGSVARVGVSFMLVSAALRMSVDAQEISADHSRISGCYAHSPRFSLEPDTIFLSLERGVKYGEQGHFLVYPSFTMVDRQRNPTFRAYWLLSRPDSVKMFWTNGHWGVGIAGVLRDSVIAGTVTPFIDYATGDPPQNAPVRLRRVSCPARLLR
jgi:hypothetical protein